MYNTVLFVFLFVFREEVIVYKSVDIKVKLAKAIYLAHIMTLIKLVMLLCCCLSFNTRQVHLLDHYRNVINTISEY